MTAHTAYRLVHILAGICWVGGVVTVAGFLLPAARTLGPAAGPMLREINGARKFPLFMQGMSWLTLLSGFALAYRDAGALGMRWFEHGMGLLIGVGAACAVLAALVGMLVSSPTARKMQALTAAVQQGARAPNEVEAKSLQALQARLFGASRVLAVLLLLASAAMAGARYM